LATTILPKRKGYYEALERNNTEIEITDWLAWFAASALEAQRSTNALVDFLIDKSRLVGEVGAALNARQRKALLRVLAEGPGGFQGGLSAANYVAITGASAPTATRDLSGLVVKGAMLREGERRYARYRANLPHEPFTRFPCKVNSSVTRRRSEMTPANYCGSGVRARRRVPLQRLIKPPNRRLQARPCGLRRPLHFRRRRRPWRPAAQWIFRLSPTSPARIRPVSCSNYHRPSLRARRPSLYPAI